MTGFISCYIVNSFDELYIGWSLCNPNKKSRAAGFVFFFSSYLIIDDTVAVHTLLKIAPYSECTLETLGSSKAHCVKLPCLIAKYCTFLHKRNP